MEKMIGSIILFVPFLGAFGGVERLILSLSAHLGEHGHSVRIACFKADPGFERVNIRSIRVDQLQTVRNPCCEAIALRKYQSSLPTDAKWLLFDLKSAFYQGLIPRSAQYFLHLTDPPTLLPTDITKSSWTVARRLGIYEKRTLSQRIRGELAHWFTKRGVANAAGTIVMTRQIAGELRALYQVTPTIIPPGVDGIAKQVVKCYNEGPIRVLSVSRLEFSKRLDHFIRVLTGFNTQKCEWRFDIVGTGSAQASLMELVEHLNLQDRIFFHGHLADEQVDQLYKESHLFVMPAIQGYGLPALEALLRGVPVILHQESGVSEYLSDTPWVCVLTNLENDLKQAIKVMFERIINHQFTIETKPTVPSLQNWCEQITLLLRA